MKINRQPKLDIPRNYIQVDPKFDPVPIAKKLKELPVLQLKTKIMEYAPFARTRIIQALPDPKQNELKVLGME